ncbi:MAG: O-antigen ligase family protein [Opitutaceae bacterium]
MGTSTFKSSGVQRDFFVEDLGATTARSATGLEASPADRWWSVSGVVSFLAAATTAFTVSLVGEMPIGEFILIGAAGWALLCLVFNHAPPGRLFRSRYFWALMIAQLIALVAYVASDLYRHSSMRDMARGWGRMVFLAIDVLALTYLFSCSRKNFLWFLIGQAAGALAYTAIHGPMFGDMWKFGVGAPITYAVFLLAPWGGALIAALAAGGMGYAHLQLDYRSMGGICLVAAVLVFVSRMPVRFRWWIAPLALAGAVAVVLHLYDEAKRGSRATRSDIERAAMLTAAKEAFEASPLIGHGSWFSNSDVYDNFMLIRHEAAKQARVGGFAGANRAPGDEALHSQILVALAEGGLFGGAFFIVFGAGLLWALAHTVLFARWQRCAPITILILLLAVWNLLFSPFSGAHRVYIAMACGLILRLRTGGPRAVEAEADA